LEQAPKGFPERRGQGDHGKATINTMPTNEKPKANATNATKAIKVPKPSPDVSAPTWHGGQSSGYVSKTRHP